jgi:hypothetical protein
MTVQSQADLLMALRRNLKSVEESGDDGLLTPAALELKHLLLRRIANIEAEIGRAAGQAVEALGRAERS